MKTEYYTFPTTMHETIKAIENEDREDMRLCGMTREVYLRDEEIDVLCLFEDKPEQVSVQLKALLESSIPISRGFLGYLAENCFSIFDESLREGAIVLFGSVEPEGRLAAIQLLSDGILNRNWGSSTVGTAVHELDKLGAILDEATLKIVSERLLSNLDVLQTSHIQSYINLVERLEASNIDFQRQSLLALLKQTYSCNKLQRDSIQQDTTLNRSYMKAHRRVLDQDLI